MFTDQFFTGCHGEFASSFHIDTGEGDPDLYGTHQASLLVFNPVPYVINVKIHSIFKKKPTDLCFCAPAFFSWFLEPACYSPSLLVTTMQFHYAWLEFMRRTFDAYFNGQ